MKGNDVMEKLEVSQLIQKILSAVYCGDLFSADKSAIIRDYRAMAKLIHPDVCGEPNAEKAITRLNQLYHAAVQKIENGTWEASNTIFLKRNDGKLFTFRYLHQKTFELGCRYVNDGALVYVLNAGSKKYYDNYLRSSHSLKYADGKMQDSFGKLMPAVKENFIAHDGRHVLVVAKTPDLVPLDLFLQHYGKGLDGRHAAWIISRMNNLCCFLFYNKISLNGFNPFNLFVTPDYHALSILGGWWYAVPYQQRMIGTSKDVYDLMSNVTKTNKLSSPVTDIESMRGIGRYIMNHTVLPKPIQEWIEAGSSSNPMIEFEKWGKALDRAYGVRKFVPIEVDNRLIYQ